MKRVDVGNFDWIVMEDDEGNVWVRPSLGWEDGEVYMSLGGNMPEIYRVLEKADVL